MKKEISCGAVIARQTENGREILLIRHVNGGHWAFPKGHMEGNETESETALREIREETGIDVSQAAGGYAFSYKRVNPEEKNNYFVDVYKFTMDIDTSDVKLQEAETSGFSFATLSEISDYAKQGIFLHYDSIKAVFD